jgi:protein involved in polysaccharide export with SLBB domain
VVDRSGRIVIPRVGPVFVSGVRYEDLPGTISRRVGQVFKNFELAVSLGQLRAIRVYVTGYVPRPGAYSVSSLSTLATALMRAGGPLASGSFRNIQLRRGDQVVSQFDLYELLLKGNRNADRTVQPDDVVLVGAVGPQVALIGSVNQPAIYELKPGETVADVMRMAGGFSALADRSRLSLERLDDRATIRVRELALPAETTMALAHGDILRAFSAVDALLPAQRQNKRVRIEGEVQRPGDYVLPPESSIRDALRAAGGMTAAAYVYGTEFSRETVRVKQQENYDRALRDLETELTRATNTQRTANAEEAGSVVARSNATARLIDRLRSIRPNGRVVLQLPPQTTDLPDLALEDGDRIYIPSRYTTVGVFGSVFNSGSYLFGDGRMLSDYLRLAGGPTRGADAESVFVIRANGAVISGRQQSSWFSGDEFARVPALPGDTLFVPEEVNKTTFLQLAKDWTQILYQLGLGVAGLRAFAN